jgi:hypothetical protein
VNDIGVFNGNTSSQFLVWRRVRIPPPYPGVLRYNWASLSLGDINTETWSSRLRVELKTDDLALQIN